MNLVTGKFLHFIPYRRDKKQKLDMELQKSTSRTYQEMSTEWKRKISDRSIRFSRMHYEKRK